MGPLASLAMRPDDLAAIERQLERKAIAVSADPFLDERFNESGRGWSSSC